MSEAPLSAPMPPVKSAPPSGAIDPAKIAALLNQQGGGANQVGGSLSASPGAATVTAPSTTNSQLSTTNAPNPQALAAGLQSFAAGLPSGNDQTTSGAAPNSQTLALANILSASPRQPQSQPAAGMPVTQGTQGYQGDVPPTPMNPMGINPVVMMRAQAGSIPDQEYIKMRMANAQQTNEIKNTRDPKIGGLVTSNLQTQNMSDLQKLQLARSQVPDGTPLAQQLDAQIQKLNYIAPIDGKPGTAIFDPITHRVVGYVPKVEDGQYLDFSDPNNPVAKPIPNYNANVQATNKAKAKGTALGTTLMVKDAYGRDVPVTSGSAADAGDTQMGLTGNNQPPNPTFAPNGNAPLQRGATVTKDPTHPFTAQDLAQFKAAGINVQGAVNAPRFGQSTTDASIQKSASDAIAQAPQIVQNEKGAVTGLENALQVLESGKVTTGVGQNQKINAIALLNNAGIPLMQGDVTGFQTLHKFLVNSMNQAAAGTGATGSDARLDAFMPGQPNADTMNAEALNKSIRYVLSQHDAAIARGNFLPQAYQQAAQAGDPNAALTAQAQWSKQYNPDYFHFNRMSPTDQAQYVQSHGGKLFVNGYNQYANQTGWVR